MENIIKDVKVISEKTNCLVYIVGGYIRKKFTHNKNNIKDVDIIVSGNIKIFIEELKKKGYSVFVIKKDMNIYRAIKEDKILDIAKIKHPNIEMDLRERDFTINAIAVNVLNDNVIDPYSGIEHINEGLIHEVTSHSIRNDRIRILRAERFKINYGMHLSFQCKNHIKEESKYIKECPKERIFTEMMNILEIDSDAIAFNVLEEDGVLKHIIPYIAKLKVIGKCKYHIEDAFTHMNLVYKNFKEILKGNLKINGMDLKLFSTYIGGYSIKNYMAFAAFCHDIGKANCYVKNGEKISFIGHDKEGANIVHELCNELGFPKKGTKFISNLVEGHMYPLGLYKNNIKNYKKSFYKLFSRYKEYIPYILILSYCDIHATKMLYDPDCEEEECVKFLEKLFIEYKVFETCKNNRFLNGKNIKEIIGIQCKEIGYILEELDRETYYNKITNKNEAIKFVKNIRY